MIINLLVYDGYMCITTNFLNKSNFKKPGTHKEMTNRKQWKTIFLIQQPASLHVQNLLVVDWK